MKHLLLSQGPEASVQGARGRILITRSGEHLEVRCPFCQNTHWHRWHEEKPHPRRYTAPCVMRDYLVTIEES